MPRLSIISHYYNHPEMVEAQIAYWESLPEAFLARVEFVLVDDCSEQMPTLRPTKLDLKVFRVISDVPWNQAGARNLGAFTATGEWALYFDIDQKFFYEPVVTVLVNLHTLDPMTMYYMRIKNYVDSNVNQPLSHHPNSFLVNLARFKQWGMYDEDFAGHYGYEDLYMPLVWERNGGRRVLFDKLEFFEDMGFRTSNLDRDLSRNKALAEAKLAAGAKNSHGILRFEWTKLEAAEAPVPPAV